MKNNEEAAGYSPRTGSKVALVFQALLDGPMPSTNLSSIMGCAPEGVNGRLAVPLRHKAIIKVKDETGLLHFALPGTELDERFTAIAAVDADQKRTIVGPTDPTDPFGLHAASKQLGGALARTLQTTAAKPTQSTTRPVPTIRKCSIDALSQPKTDLAAAAQPAAEEAFVAALFSTGNLMISVGENSVVLNEDHQRQLHRYITRFK